jgi:hypothetical protein
MKSRVKPPHELFEVRRQLARQDDVVLVAKLRADLALQLEWDFSGLTSLECFHHG